MNLINKSEMLKDISDKMNDVWADQAETGIASIATFTMMYGGRKKKTLWPPFMDGVQLPQG